MLVAVKLLRFLQSPEQEAHRGLKAVSAHWVQHAVQSSRVAQHHAHVLRQPAGLVTQCQQRISAQPSERVSTLYYLVQHEVQGSRVAQHHGHVAKQPAGLTATTSTCSYTLLAS